MTIHWESFWLGVAVIITVTVAFFVIYIKIAEWRLRRMQRQWNGLDDERGKG